MTSASGYLKPHPVLAELVSDPTPSFAFSPKAEYCLLFDQPTHLSLEDVVAQEVRIAGLRFNGALRSASRVRWSSWAKLRPVRRMVEQHRGVNEADDRDIRVPHGTRMRSFEFSKTNEYLAFLVDGKTNTELWVASVATGEARRLMMHLNSVLAKPFQWKDNHLLVMTIPLDKRGDAPKAPPVPASPLIREHDGGKAAPARTYHDLLQSDHDEVVFEHFATSDVFLCDAATGKSTRFFPSPGLFSSIEISPDKRHLIVHQVARPYSRVLPASRFSKNISVVRLDAPLSEWTGGPSGMQIMPFAFVPCQEDMSTSFDARPRGPRSVEFAWNEPHTVVYTLALDDGEPANTAGDSEGNRDGIFFVRNLDGPLLMQHEASDKQQQQHHERVFAGKLRADSIYWTEEGAILVEESWYKTREENMWVVPADKQSSTPRLLYSRSSDDAYASWGSPRVEYVQDKGTWRLKRRPVDGRILFLGEGASPNGSRPFADYVDILTGHRERVWRSPPVPEPQSPEDPVQEVAGVAPDDATREAVFQRAVEIIHPNHAPLFAKETLIVLVSESPSSPPNIVAKRLASPRLPEIALTMFPNPQLSLLGVKKELIRYSRADGVELSATLYVPKGYDGKTPLPLLCWAYPLEFKSKEHASQIKTSQFRFIHTAWHRPTLWLSRGWAVLDDFSVPIVGVGESEPNDTFIEQLVSSAEAAVAECVRRGVADPEKVAVGGHSYGAFMTAHLLAHTRLFKAGIGRSGAYNRLLTPFSYQSEERTFWQAPQTYVRNSPFTHADAIQAPILLIHGQDDPNPGTHAFQSERLFAALQGLGKRARLVLLPCERHSYDALESVLHVVAEQDMFLSKHVLGEGLSDTDHEIKRAKI